MLFVNLKQPRRHRRAPSRDAPNCGFVVLFADEDTWRLLLALPAMASNPPQVVYNRLIDILNRRVQKEISVDRVGLMPPEITLSHC